MDSTISPASVPQRKPVKALSHALLWLVWGFFFGGIGLVFFFLSTPRGDQVATATGTVTSVLWVSDEHDACAFSYRFNVDGKGYSDKTRYGSSNICKLSTGNEVEIRYNPSNPDESSYVDTSVAVFSLFFIVPGSIVFVIGIFNVARWLRHRRKGDLDGDGWEYDARPATDEQMRLIENGFYELGQFYQPSTRRPTQAQAREILQKIDRQLEQTKRRP
jgi:hypothetical protein